MESLIMSFDALEMSVDVCLLKSDPPKTGEFVRALESSRFRLDSLRRAGQLNKSNLALLGCIVHLLIHTSEFIPMFDFSVDDDSRRPGADKDYVTWLLRKTYRACGVSRVPFNTFKSRFTPVLGAGELDFEIVKSSRERRGFAPALARRPVFDSSMYEKNKEKSVSPAFVRHPVVEPVRDFVPEGYKSRVVDDQKWSVVTGGGDVPFVEGVEAVSGSSLSSGFVLKNMLKIAREKTDLDYKTESEARAQYGSIPFRKNDHWPPRFGVSNVRFVIWKSIIDEFNNRDVSFRRAHTIAVNSAYDMCQRDKRSRSELHLMMVRNANLYVISNHYVAPAPVGLKLGDFFPAGTFFRLRERVFFKIEHYSNFVLSLFLNRRDIMIVKFLLNRIVDAFYKRKGLNHVIGSIVSCVGTAVGKLVLSKGRSVFDLLFDKAAYRFMLVEDYVSFMGAYECYVKMVVSNRNETDRNPYDGLLAECFNLSCERRDVEMLEVNHMQGIPLAGDLPTAASEFLSSLEWDRWKKEIPFMVKLVSMITILVQAKTWSVVVSTMVLALSDYEGIIVGGAEFLIKQIEALTPLVKKFVGSFSYQGGGSSKIGGDSVHSSFEEQAMETVRKAFLAPDGSSFASSDLGGALYDLFASFSFMGVFSMCGLGGSPAFIRSKIKEFSYLLKQDPREDIVESFVSRLMRLLSVCADRVYTAISNRDWRQLIRDDMTFSKWVYLVDTLIDDECVRFDPARPDMERLFRVKKLAGFLPSQLYKPLNAEERLAMLRETVGYANGLRSRYAASPHIVAIIRHKETNTMGAIRTLEAIAGNSSFRIPPWSFYLYGEPGVGKTSLAARFNTALGDFLGYPGGSSSMYRPDPKSNFEDGFNQSQWACLCDDIDTSVAPESASVRNHAELINKYVNSAPHNMEQADIGGKGKLFANFLSLYYLSNIARGNLKDRVLEPYQFWRRMLLYITMKIRPEFDDGKGGIHRTKAYDDGVLKKNIWTFEVRSYDPSCGNDNDPFNVLPYSAPVVFNTETDLFRSLIEHYREYHARQQKVYAARKEAERQDIEKCPSCYLPIELHNGSFCSGEAVRLQGDPLTALVMVGYSIAWYAGVAYCLTNAYSAIVAKWSAYVAQLPAPILDMVQVWVFEQMISFFGVKNFWIGALARWYHGSTRPLYERIEESHWFRYFRGLVPSRKVLGGLLLVLGAVPLLRRYFERSIVQGVSEPNPTGLPKRVDVWQSLNRVLYDRPYSVRVKPTYSREEMCAILQRRMVRVQGPVCTVYGTMAAGGVLIFPQHCIHARDPRGTVGSFEDVEIVVSFGGVSSTIKLISRLTTTLAGRDIVITHVPEVTVFKEKWNLLDEIPPTCLASSGQRADESWIVFPDKVVKYDEAIVPTDRYDTSFPNGLACWSGVVPTQDGDCGAPVVARFGDRFYWVGAHGVERISTYPGGIVRKTAVAESYAMREMDIYIKLIKRFNPSSLEVVCDPKTVDPTAESLVFQGLPERSSLNVSLCFQPDIPVIVFGEYVGKVRFGASLASKIVPTCFKHKVMDDLAKEVLPNDVFEAPRFRGKMMLATFKGEEVIRYVDPHTRALEQSSNKGGDSVYWEMALRDYLIDLEKLSGSTGIVPLSDYATIVGVDGTTCGGVDLQTSAGAPFYRKKNVCIRIDRSVDPPSVEFISELSDGIKRILEIVDAGDVYSPVAVHCLKDECVTSSKNAKAKIRVFNIMPFAFNFLLKKYISPIVAFYRLHNLHFEHAIGLNVAGVRDAKLLYSFLKRYNNCIASDVSDFDITASTRELYYSSLVVQSMAYTLGYSDDERKRLWGLLMSAMHVTHVNKGDFWFSNYGLASGYWITLFLNCIRNSLQSRYAYFQLGAGFELPPFRSVVNLMVLGDDNIGCVHPGFTWYNQVSVAESLKSIGAKRTSSVKDRALVPYEPFNEATFLKRTFREVNGIVVCAIEKKTLLRMLSCRRKTTLSDHDHRCVILSTVLAESWMWGREFFTLIRGMALDLASQHHLGGRNLVIDEFDDYFRKYESGELITWDVKRSEEEAFPM